MTLNPAWFLNATGQFRAVTPSDAGISTTTTTALLTFLTTFMSTASVAATTNGSYTTGVNLAQGSTGTWLAIGTLCFQNTALAVNFAANLSAGGTTFASAFASNSAAGFYESVSLSGIITDPTGNISLACKPGTGSVSNFIIGSASGSGAKDTHLTVIRIG